MAAKTNGIFYVRTSRPAAPIIYDNDTKFEIGKAHVVKKSDSDKILIVGGGVTTAESIKTHATL